MPIYEYRCEACGHEFEEVQRITAPPLENCPACGRPSVHRLISRSSFILKGSGWYVTDYARKAASGSDGGGDAAKGEAKPSGAPSSPAGSSPGTSSSGSAGSSGESKPAPAAAAAG